MTRLQTASTVEVSAAIEKERRHQLDKYGWDKEQSLPGFFVILEAELAEAKLAWLKGGIGRQSAMHEVLQIAATAVAALEAYGITGCPRSLNDEPPTDPDACGAEYGDE